MVRFSPRSAASLIFFLALTHANGAKPAPGLTDPAKVLDAAVAKNNLDAAGVSPWEMDATLQLFDKKGNLVETLGLDLIWGGPREEKQTWTRQGAAHDAVVINPDGAYGDSSPSQFPDLAQMAVRTVIHPIPSAEEAKQDRLALQREKYGHMAFNCVVSQSLASEVMAIPGQVALMRPAAQYCFDDGSLNYRFTQDGGLTFEAAITKVFQDRTYAAVARVKQGKVVRASLTVHEIKSIPKPDPSTFVPNDDQVQIEPSANALGKVKPGKLIHREEPQVPEALLGTPATVVVNAVVDQDGHIRSAKAMGESNPQLAAAATNAVKQWVYEPFTRNGKPVEQRIAVTFTFGK